MSAFTLNGLVSPRRLASTAYEKALLFGISDGSLSAKRTHIGEDCHLILLAAV